MNFSYYYVVKNGKQTTFDGREYVVDIPQGEFHIVYQDVCLCREARIPKKVVNGKRGVTAKTRPYGIPLCPECERLYKANKDSEWHKWVENVKA